MLRGEQVFNYGVYFVYRTSSCSTTLAISRVAASPRLRTQRLFTRLNQTQYIPDLWLQFLWEGLRVELEAAFVAGSLEGGARSWCNDSDTGPLRDAVEIVTAHVDQRRNQQTLHPGTDGQCKFRQLGFALESEYRLLR